MMKKFISVLLMVSLLMTSCCVCASASTGDVWNDNYIYKANGYVNVRSGPSTNHQIIGALVRNMIIPGQLPTNGWVPVYYKGNLGYVYATYLTQTAKPLSECTQTIYQSYCRITGYDLCMRCCGKAPGSSGYGITASGTYAQAKRTVGMKGHPYGTRIYIEGLGYYIVEDTGYIGYNHVDVYCNNHSECYGVNGYRNVYIVK
jgi:3D (Asp-Asp-Asp) domain-containing protein